MMAPSPWRNGTTGVDTRTEIALGLRRLPHQAHRRAFHAAMRPVEREYATAIVAAVKAYHDAIAPAITQLNIDWPKQPQKGESRIAYEHKIREAYRAVERPAHTAFREAIEQARVQFMAALAESLRSAEAFEVYTQ